MLTSDFSSVALLVLVAVVMCFCHSTRIDYQQVPHHFMSMSCDCGGGGHLNDESLGGEDPIKRGFVIESDQSFGSASINS